MKNSVSIVLLCLSLHIQGQALKLNQQFDLGQSPVAISIDRYGKLYFGFSNGEIERYDAEGNLEFNNSTNRRFPIRLIEAWQGLKTFVYSSAYQEYFF